MPAELFRSHLPSTPARSRASLLPVSVATHVAVLAAVVIAPLFTEGGLPDPNRPLLYAVTKVELPPPPPVRPVSIAPRPVSNPDAAPTEAPSAILPEPVVPEGSDALGVDDGDLVGIADGAIGSLGTPIPIEPLPPPPVERKPVRPGGNIQPPRRLVNVAPVYPPIAQSARVEGTVEIEALIGEDGKVRNAKVTVGKPLLNDAALRAVRQWVFTPTRLNGEPVAVIMTVTVVFSLQ